MFYFCTSPRLYAYTHICLYIQIYTLLEERRIEVFTCKTTTMKGMRYEHTQSLKQLSPVMVFLVDKQQKGFSKQGIYPT